ALCVISFEYACVSNVLCDSFLLVFFFFFSSRRRHTRSYGDWSSDVCSSDLPRSDRSRRLPTGAGLVLEFLSSCRSRTGSRRHREIGRASCRERVWISGGGGSLYRKK